MRTPDYRYQEVLSAGTSSEALVDPFQIALCDVLNERECEERAVVYALDLYRNSEHRAVVDAFLLAKTPLDTMARVLEVPEGVLKTYMHLFMDVSVFRNKLEIMSYAAAYEGSPYGKEMVKTAVSVGQDYLLWAYGGVNQVDTREIVRRTMIDSYFRGMAHKGNSLTSNMAKEAQKWWQTAIKNAETLERIEPRAAKDAFEELRIAIEGKDETIRADQAPVPLTDILH